MPAPLLDVWLQEKVRTSTSVHRYALHVKRAPSSRSRVVAGHGSAAYYPALQFYYAVDAPRRELELGRQFNRCLSPSPPPQEFPGSLVRRPIHLHHQVDRTFNSNHTDSRFISIAKALQLASTPIRLPNESTLTFDLVSRPRLASVSSTTKPNYRRTH